MNVPRRRLLAVAGASVGVLALASGLAAGAGNDERLAVRGVAENAPSTTTSLPAVESGPTTTLALRPVTTGVPVPNAVEAPPPTLPPSATPAAPRAGTATPASGAAPAAGTGTAVTGAGAVLTRSTSGATRKVDKAEGCNSARADGWEIEECGALRTSGTVLLWLVETKGKGSRALVLKEQTAGTWLVVLSAADVDGRAFARIGVRGEDVSGDGQPELVFGFHRNDAAKTLAVDVVDASPVVVVHRDLAGGAVRLSKGEITTWSMAESEGGYDQITIRNVDGTWRAGVAQRVARSAVPASSV